MKSSYDKNRVSIIATGPVSTLGSGSVASNACRFLYSSLTDCLEGLEGQGVVQNRQLDVNRENLQQNIEL